MKTISARDLVNFTRKTEKSKQTFALKVKTEVDKSNSGSGGDYWVHSISAICNSIKLNDIVPIEEKKEILVNKHYNSSVQRSKVMYERNIRVLDTFADMDFSSWAPDSGPKFKKIPQKPFVLMFNGVGIKVRPNLLFSFNLNDNTPQIGAIWFVPNVDGFKKTELGLFVNLLYEYLIQKHGEQYVINSTYCSAIELFNGSAMNHMDLIDSETITMLEESVQELIKFMK